MNKYKYDVFLSYNSKDKSQVRRLAETLRSVDIRVWFDEWVLTPGEDIYSSIEKGLKASQNLILCISRSALGSGWVALEQNIILFRDSINAKRRFIPLIL